VDSAVPWDEVAKNIEERSGQVKEDLVTGLVSM
jgi:hypothetical protein